MTDAEFADIVGTTKTIVLSAVRKHLAARFSHAVDDVVQETYIRGYRHLAGGKFRHDSSLESWLYAIARNESLRMNERLAREEEKSRRAASARAVEDPADPDPFAGYDIDGLIDSLPAIYRDVLKLKGTGASESDIARRLGISPGTVKSRLSRGRNILRKISREAL